MDKLTAIAIENQVEQLFQLRKDHITEKLFESCNSEDSYEQVYAKAIIKSMIISTETAVEIIIDTLIRIGLTSYADEKTIRKNIMRIVKEENVQRGRSET